MDATWVCEFHVHLIDDLCRAEPAVMTQRANYCVLCGGGDQTIALPTREPQLFGPRLMPMGYHLPQGLQRRGRSPAS
jgi:hypothetical protein